MGPGFDCMGMALDFYNYIDFEPTDTPGECILTADGAAGAIDLSKDKQYSFGNDRKSDNIWNTRAFKGEYFKTVAQCSKGTTKRR